METTWQTIGQKWTKKDEKIKKIKNNRAIDLQKLKSVVS
jgi:hypothetical protein